MRKSIAIILSALVLAGCASENTGSSANTETEAATLAPHEIKESSAAVVDNTDQKQEYEPVIAFSCDGKTFDMSNMTYQDLLDFFESIGHPAEFFNPEKADMTLGPYEVMESWQPHLLYLPDGEKTIKLRVNAYNPTDKEINVREGKVYEIAGLDEITRSTTFPLDMEIGGITLETCKGKNGEREQKLSELGFAIENDNPYHSKTLDDGRELRFYGDIIFQITPVFNKEADTNSISETSSSENVKEESGPQFVAKKASVYGAKKEDEDILVYALIEKDPDIELRKIEGGFLPTNYTFEGMSETEQYVFGFFGFNDYNKGFQEAGAEEWDDGPLDAEMLPLEVVNWENGEPIKWEFKSASDKAELIEYGILPSDGAHYTTFPESIEIPSDDSYNNSNGVMDNETPKFKLNFIKYYPDLSFVDEETDNSGKFQVLTEDGKTMEELFGAKSVSMIEESEEYYLMLNYEGDLSAAPAYEELPDLVKQLKTLQYSLEDGTVISVPIWANNN